MKKNFFLLAVTSLFCTSVLFTSCNKDDDSITDTNSNLELNISGLKDLGASFRYECWIVTDSSNPAISVGTFTVNASGVMSQTSFPVATNNLNAATNFYVSIEPYPDTNSHMSTSILLGGSFTNGIANLTIKDGIADYSSSTGKYLLASPTDAVSTNENSGLWFVSTLGTPLPNTSLPESGLQLPPIIGFTTIVPGWKYEGWVVINGKTLSTGKFTHLQSSDDFNGYSGSIPTVPFAGEDFLNNAPTGLTFPTDLSGSTVFVTIEPNPDNSPEPFFLKPLSAAIPTSAVTRTAYDMTNTISMNAPTGTAVR